MRDTVYTDLCDMREASMRLSLWNKDGYIHMATPVGRKSYHTKEVDKKNEIKNICLNCTKEKCREGDKCFKNTMRTASQE
jgi:hypothetical protein